MFALMYLCKYCLAHSCDSICLHSPPSPQPRESVTLVQEPCSKRFRDPGANMRKAVACKGEHFTRPPCLVKAWYGHRVFVGSAHGSGLLEQLELKSFCCQNPGPQSQQSQGNVRSGRQHNTTSWSNSPVHDRRVQVLVLPLALHTATTRTREQTRNSLAKQSSARQCAQWRAGPRNLLGKFTEHNRRVQVLVRPSCRLAHLATVLEQTSGAEALAKLSGCFCEGTPNCNDSNCGTEGWNHQY